MFSALATMALPATAQNIANNFADRKAVIINNAEDSIKLSQFSFRNFTLSTGVVRFAEDLTWTNTSDKAVTAFEVVLLYYDPFNRAMPGLSGRRLVTGHDSANWSPLKSGEKDGDGLLSYGAKDAYTGIVYVRAIRFEDGTFWYSNQSQVEKQIAAAIPSLKEIGQLDPGPRKETPPE